MLVELRDIDSIKPYDQNPRLNDGAVAAVAKSIESFGFRQPIVVDKEGVIVVGHTRWKAAESLGMTTVPVHIAHELTPEQAKAYRLADNQTAAIAEWDLDLLNLELAELKALDFPIDSLGWTPEELDELLSPPGTDGNGDPDEIPEPPETPITQVGDLWLLGGHRLLCGDSTKPEDVARVMDGAAANLLFCDPPYGVAYQTKLSVEEAVARRRRTDGLEVANDDLGREGTRKLVATALANAAAHLKPGASFYVCAPAGAGDEGDVGLVFRRALEDAGLRLRQTIAWVKDIFVMGRQDYHWRHEDILYGWKDGAAHYFVDDRTQDTVWEIPRPKRSESHPTMKPVELVTRALANSTKKGGLVLEVFSGSGTTIMACEQLGRRCCAIELEPRYVDVAVARWEKFTGKKAERVPANSQSEKAPAGAEAKEAA